MKFYGRDILLASIIASLVVPLQMSLMPILTVYNDFGALFGVAESLILEFGWLILDLDWPLQLFYYGIFKISTK